ncbi:Dirigent protein 23 [Sesamum alatum]|uniref:Dirigent protein n=1 Tax=Sesamum alatum TaxID=300844 RepID=A0AAE1YWQ0_9LAMI|nr:Dirigent protein 23 [Sesamum alatum]
MARLDIFLVLAITCTWAAAAQPQPNDDEVTWAKRVETGTQLITTLQFYFHDNPRGQNPTTTNIAQGPQTNNSSTLFGLLTMLDDPLTVGPDPSSKVVGRARGLYGSAGQMELRLIMVVSYGFTDGIYNGSSFSLLSINPALQPVREMAIVGGTGLFRLASGYAVVRTYWLDATTGNVITGYNVTIATYL